MTAEKKDRYLYVCRIGHNKVCYYRTDDYRQYLLHMANCHPGHRVQKRKEEPLERKAVEGLTMMHIGKLHRRLYEVCDLSCEECAKQVLSQIEWCAVHHGDEIPENLKPAWIRKRAKKGRIPSVLCAGVATPPKR